MTMFVVLFVRSVDEKSYHVDINVSYVTWYNIQRAKDEIDRPLQ